MADQTPVTDPYCPQCGREFEWIWVIAINKGSPPPGFSAVFTPEQRDVARCEHCGVDFERTDGAAWRRQPARPNT